MTQPTVANWSPLSPLTFLDRAAGAFSERVALVDGERQITFQQLEERARRLAGGLRAAGLVQGDRVAVIASNGPALLEAHFGVPLAGCVLVPINTRLSTSEIGYILRHADVRALIVDAELMPTVEPALGGDLRLNLRLVCGDGATSGADYETFLAGAAPWLGAPAFTHEDDPLSINYTSGTTGRPKGVVCTHRGAYLNALNVALDLRMGPDSVYLWTLPMFHCNGWSLTWGCVAAGARQVNVRRVEAAAIWDRIEQQRVTHFCAAPTVLIDLANHPSARPQPAERGLRVATGGAPPSPTTISQMASLGVEVIHLYGMTETYGPSLSCAWWPEWNALSPADQARQKARQGVPHNGIVQASIVDVELHPVPADGQTMGELVLRGNTIMQGYYRDEAATAEAFRGGWFHTGDLGVMHPDGYVELRDRAKDVIISGGENISTIEVEQALLRHPAVLEVAVVGIPDERWGEVPKAFVTLRPDAAADANELIDFCKQQIARFKAPKSVAFGSLPRTSTGKIQKYVLREQEWAGRSRRVN